MIVVLQRVERACVRVEDAVVGRIGAGLVALVAVQDGDGAPECDWCAKKVSCVRVFPDESGKMNLSVLDVEGSVLAVSQFTLVGNLNKGTRPSFSGAAPPEAARNLFDRFVVSLKGTGIAVETGVFQAMMKVELVNDGPVTLIIRKEPLKKKDTLEDSVG